MRTILHETEIPAIYVTHDQGEAFTIADRVLILHDGEIIRKGTPDDVWADPGSVFAAEFLGLGTIMHAEMVAKNKFQTEYGFFTVRCDHKHSNGDKVHLLARPLSVKGGANVISGVVTDVIFQQERYRVTLENGLYVHMEDAPEIGEKVSVKVKVECLA